MLAEYNLSIKRIKRWFAPIDDTGFADLEELDGGEDVKVPYLEIASPPLVTLQHGLYCHGLVNAGHHSAQSNSLEK